MSITAILDNVKGHSFWLRLTLVVCVLPLCAAWCKVAAAKKNPGSARFLAAAPALLALVIAPLIFCTESE
jgi:hypothetical protein